MNILAVTLLLLGVTRGYAGDLKQEVMDRINYHREHPNDRSHFFINAASKDQPVSDRHTKVHFIVTDSSGRKTGFESFFVFPEGDLGINSFREISNTAYGIDQTGSINPEDPPEPESATLNFFSPVLSDTYTITLIGFGDVRYFADMHLTDVSGETHDMLNEDYISSGTTKQYAIYLDPTPGAPAPVITKTVTFDALRSDVSVARQLNQLGEEKFARSLVKNIDLAEKLSGVCDKRKHRKDKSCEPAIAVLKLFIKRLELANRKCDNPADCDEEREWTAFRKEHGRDDDYKDFFRDWDKDGWHKDKKTAKRFVTDEALKIISDDVQWSVKSLGGEIYKDQGKGDSDKRDGKDSGKNDR